MGLHVLSECEQCTERFGYNPPCTKDLSRHRIILHFVASIGNGYLPQCPFIAGSGSLLFWFFNKRDIFPRMFCWFAAVLITGRILLLGLSWLSPASATLNGMRSGMIYELLFTAPPKAKIPNSIAGVAISAIGEMSKRRKKAPLITLSDQNNRPVELLPKGWEHFR